MITRFLFGLIVLMASAIASAQTLAGASFNPEMP